MTIPPADAPLTTAARLAIGTYAGGGGEGVYPLDADWTLGAAYRDAPNASFGTYAPRHALHYLVDERDDGAIGVHRHAAGRWMRLARHAVGGDAPCHVALNHAQTALAVANYASGSVTLFALDADGLPIAPPQVHANRGQGPDTERQQAPHAHWVGFSPDDRWLYQTDLGTDQLLAFPVADGRLGAARIAYAAPPGAGPRHLLLHPNHPGRAYLASELANTLTLLDRKEDRFQPRAILPTRPAGATGKAIVAHLCANRAGDRLYVTNRGDDSIAVFALDADGVPTLLQHAPAGGASPRFCLLLERERRMIVANERAQTVTVLAVEPDGRLAPTGISLAVPGAACVLDLDPAA